MGSGHLSVPVHPQRAKFGGEETVERLKQQGEPSPSPTSTSASQSEAGQPGELQAPPGPCPSGSLLQGLTPPPSTCDSRGLYSCLAQTSCPFP